MLVLSDKIDLLTSGDTKNDSMFIFGSIKAVSLLATLERSEPTLRVLRFWRIGRSVPTDRAGDGFLGVFIVYLVY